MLWGGGNWEGKVPNGQVYIDNIEHIYNGNNRSLPVEFYTVCPCNFLCSTVCLTFCRTVVSWLRLVLISILCKSDSQPNLLSSPTDSYSALQLVVSDRFVSGQKFDFLYWRLFQDCCRHLQRHSLFFFRRFTMQYVDVHTKHRYIQIVPKMIHPFQNCSVNIKSRGIFFKILWGKIYIWGNCF